MSDPQTPNFTVVDRRRATSEDAPPSAENAAPSVSDPNPAAMTPDAAQTEAADSSIDDIFSAARSAGAPVAPGAGEPESEDDTDAAGDLPFLPEPAMLLSMAAMQMDTRALATALIAAFDGHAWYGMGLVANPLTGETKKDLPSAQLAIDCVQFLLGKVESSLSAEERREAQRRLSDLRMNYLTKAREA